MKIYEREREREREIERRLGNVALEIRNSYDKSDEAVAKVENAVRYAAYFQEL